MTVIPYVYTIWSNSVTFDANLTSYALDNKTTAIFANVELADGTIVLLSNVEPSFGVSIIRADTSFNSLTITTDNANCLINTVNSISIDSLEQLKAVMGFDGNYYASLSYLPGDTCIDIEAIIGTPLANGYVLTFSNVPYIAVLSQNSSGITITTGDFFQNASEIIIEFGLFDSNSCSNCCCSDDEVIYGETLANGYYIDFINVPYIPFISQNSSSVTIYSNNYYQNTSAFVMEFADASC